MKVVSRSWIVFVMLLPVIFTEEIVSSVPKWHKISLTYSPLDSGLVSSSIAAWCNEFHLKFERSEAIYTNLDPMRHFFGNIGDLSVSCQCTSLDNHNSALFSPFLRMFNQIGQEDCKHGHRSQANMTNILKTTKTWQNIPAICITVMIQIHARTHARTNHTTQTTHIHACTHTHIHTCVHTTLN